MAKSKAKVGPGQVKELQAKVLRRSDKLAKSLRQLVSQIEPGRNPAQTLLKALENALPHLQQVAKASPVDGSSKAAPKRTKSVKEADAPRPGRTHAAKKPPEKVTTTAPESSAA